MRPTKHLITFCLLISFSVVGLAQTPKSQKNLQNPKVLAQIQFPPQVTNDIKNLKTITTSPCDEASLALRNTIMRRSFPTYFRRYQNLLNAFLQADNAIIRCLQNSIDDKDQKTAQLQGELVAAERYKTQLYSCQRDKKFQEKVYLTIISGGGIILIVIVILLIKTTTTKKILDKIMDSMKDKLLDVVVGKIEDRTWKRKFEDIQDLYSRYQNKQIKVREFERQLDAILRA